MKNMKNTTTEDYKAAEENPNDLPPWQRYIACPHCGERISVELNVRLINVRPADSLDENGSDQKAQSFQEYEQRILDLAKQHDIIRGFVDAWNTHNIEGPLNNDYVSSRAFLGFLRRATPKRVPQFVLDTYCKQFPGRLTFVAHNGVIAVCSNGTLCGFFPVRFITREKVNAIGSGFDPVSLPATERQLEEWIRTKHGYVIGRGPFFEAMQRRSKGEFMDISL
jgi:hypothetical protein